MSNYSKILNLGYKFNKRPEQYALDIISPDGTSKRFGFSMGLERVLYFGPDKLPISEMELINDVFHPSAEELCHFMNGYSLRTQKYFDGLKKRIGFIGHAVISDGYEWPIDFEKTKYYVSELHTDIDSCEEVNYYFNHNPSVYEEKTAKLLIDVQIKFRMNRYKEEFTCWECGHKTHWLDVKGDFFQKVDCLEDQYCGC